MYLLEQHSEPFKIWSAIIRINTEGINPWLWNWAQDSNFTLHRTYTRIWHIFKLSALFIRVNIWQTVTILGIAVVRRVGSHFLLGVYLLFKIFHSSSFSWSNSVTRMNFWMKPFTIDSHDLILYLLTIKSPFLLLI